MQVIKNVEQGSDEWKNLRLGKVTASRFKDVMSKGQGVTRRNYMTELAAEILTNTPQESYTNQAMEWGIETEAQARATYELMECVDVERVSFVIKNENIGVSPDGLVSDDGLVEIKCPKTSTQIETFMKGEMSSKYIPQVQGQLWVCEREWCDFVSFDPRIEGLSQYFRVRVYRDDKYISMLDKEVDTFISELQDMLNILR